MVIIKITTFCILFLDLYEYNIFDPGKCTIFKITVYYIISENVKFKITIQDDLPK